MEWFAYEVCTDESYHVIADRDKTKLYELQYRLNLFLNSAIVTEASGTLLAENLDEAFDKIRRGDWNYSQLC